MGEESCIKKDQLFKVDGVCEVEDGRQSIVHRFQDAKDIGEDNKDWNIWYLAVLEKTCPMQQN